MVLFSTTTRFSLGIKNGHKITEQDGTSVVQWKTHVGICKHSLPTFTSLFSFTLSSSSLGLLEFGLYGWFALALWIGRATWVELLVLVTFNLWIPKEAYRTLRCRISADFRVHNKEYHANTEIYSTEQTKQLQTRKIARAATRITRNIGRNRFYEPNSRWQTDEKPGTKSRASSRMLGRDTAPLDIFICLITGRWYYQPVALTQSRNSLTPYAMHSMEAHSAFSPHVQTIVMEYYNFLKRDWGRDTRGLATSWPTSVIKGMLIGACHTRFVKTNKIFCDRFKLYHKIVSYMTILKK